MRTTTTRGKLTLLFMAFAMMLALPATAFADNVYNNLDGSVDAIAESIALTEGGTNDSASVLISPTNGDGKNGCNLTSSSILKVKANSSDATKVKATLVDPANTSLAKDTFTSCSDSIKVKVEAVAVTGSTPVTVSLSEVANTTGASFDLRPATFTVTVDAAPVTNTKPALTLPANMTEEATSSAGAAVSYTASANDQEDGALTPDCKPASGSTFGLGTTTVDCSVTDSGGLSDSGSFTVRVADTTAPKLNMPENKTVEATGPNGATVSFARTASDIVDGAVAVTCEANGAVVKSGDTFALGTTNVDCSATDAAGNKASDSFAVTVEDTTAPKLALPANVTEEASGPNGNAVTYNASASDLVSGNVNVTCEPASGTIFPIDSTTVDCSASDAAGNKATGSFTVKVEDTTAPNNLQFVGNIGDGDSFFFGDAPAQPTCTAADGGSGLNDAGCVVTGYKAAVGTHTLTATATDKAGNTATREISYTVKPYTLNGFYQPIDMNGIVNTVKNGSTVPVKFELFKGATELTSTGAVTSISAKQVNCAAFNGDPIDAIETTATGATSLRYDATGGQFVYNWQTPRGASQVGKCYSLTMTAADSSTMTAYFKLK